MLSERERRLVEDLMANLDPDQIAQRHGVDPSFVSQVRARLRREGGFLHRTNPSATIPVPALVPGTGPVPTVGVPTTAGSVFLGFNDNMESVYWQLATLTNRHLILAGGSGGGKSYCALCLMRELVRLNYAVLNFDFTESSSSANPGPDDKPEISLFRSMVPVHEYRLANQLIDFNPLRIPPDDMTLGPSAAAERVATILKKLDPQMGARQFQVLKEAIRSLFRRAGILPDLVDRHTWHLEPPPLWELKNELMRMPDPKAKDVLDRLDLFFSMRRFGAEGERIDWHDLIFRRRGVSVFNMNGMGLSLPAAWTAMLLWDLLFTINQKKRDACFFALVDEAHAAGADEAEGVGDKLFREGRKHGAGVIYATQSPTDLADPILDNAAALILCPGPDRTGAIEKTIARSIKEGNAKALSQELKGRPPGQVLFIQAGMPEFVRIASLQERLDSR